MTDFKTIVGKNIRLQTSDLTMSTATEGELFYSNTDKEFKVGIMVKAWASGAVMPVAQRAAGAGIQTAAFVTGGPTPGSARVVTTHEYDGSSWSSGGDINTARNYHSAAVQSTLTAGLIFGGKAPGFTGVTEEYDGSSWTESGDLNTARTAWMGGVGTQTAAICAGGGPDYKNESEEYDGTSWAEGNNLNVSRQGLAAAGSQTAGLVFGGEIPNPGAQLASDSTEEYNGTSWTAGEAMGAGRYRHGGCGTQTAAIAFLGRINPPASDKVEAQVYDGTDWATTSSLSTARAQAAGFGIQTSAVAAGGSVASADANTTAVEEYSETVTLKTVTDS